MCKLCGRSDISYLENERLNKSLDSERRNAEKGLLYRVCLKDYKPKELYKFLYEKNSGESIHDNLLEQAKLNMKYGLYLVSAGKKCGEEKRPDQMGKDEKYSASKGDVFQIRGYDLASMTLVYDGSGWIVMDVLTTKERAEAVWNDIVVEYFNLARDQPCINTIIYSHSHIDHYGGIGGLEKYIRPDCEILAPEGFTKYAVSENIYVGAAMKRRAMYQYGSNLPLDATGCVDCGLGKAVSVGTNTIRIPTIEIGSENYLSGKKYCVYDATEGKLLKTKKEVIEKADNLILQIQYTPGTEAPAEMNVYMPEQKVLFIAENCAGTLHNTLTPRGAEVRDPLAWANFLDETLVSFPDLEIVCNAHNWPHFGHEDSVEFIEIQRDMYRYINNATLHLINLGYTIDEVGRMISGEDGTIPLPKDFADTWCCHGFYGTYNHDAKAVYQRYMGWYDGNPSHLNRHKPADRASRYVKAFNGAEGLLEHAEKAFQDMDYEWAAELYDYLLNADRTLITDVSFSKAAEGYAATLREMGYRSESPSWRNMYLTGAREVALLKDSYNSNSTASHLEFDENTVNAMTLEMILQYIGIMLDSRSLKEELGCGSLTIQIKMTGSKATEYAKVSVKADRGVLDYRILTEEEKEESGILIEGEKSVIFYAFVEHDITKLETLIIDSNDRLKVGNFITNCLTRFPLNFPIMTSVPPLDSEDK